MSKFFPAHYMATDAGSRALAEALIEIEELLPTETKPTNCMMGAKGQGGLPADLAAELHTTGLNPVLLDATGTYLLMYNIPSLPEVPVSSRLLQTLLPRLQTYVLRDPSDPLLAICKDGAAGNESAAVDCMAQWHARIPGLQAKLEKVRQR